MDQNLIEIYVNNGEYVLSNVVYGLGTEIESRGVGEILLYAADKSSGGEYEKR